MILDLIFLLGLALSAVGYGRLVLRLARVRPEPIADRLALAVPLGLGAIALALLGLGEFGLLRGDAAAWVIACGCVPAFGAFRGERLRNPKGFSPVWDGLFAVGLIGSFLTALLPVTDGDALCYHLQVPKVFLETGSVGFQPDLHETIYPLVTETLYAAALALRGPVACRLIQWLLGVVFAANTTALARPFLGDRARRAGTIALLVPAVSNGMGAPLNDVALAAFSTAAIFAWTLWREDRGVRSALLAGAALGLAFGVKYPALVLGGVLLAVAAAEELRRGRRLLPLLLFGAAAVLVGGCWYLRAYLATGNPVFPFFRSVFGGAGLDEVLDPIKRPMRVTPWNVLTALVPMTLDPARFDSFSHQFGPVFLLFLPALFLERPPVRLRVLVAVGFGFLCICLTQRQSMRFVLPAVGPFAVGVAWLADRWSERPGTARRGLAAALILCLAFEAALAAARPRSGLAYLAGRESAEAYLSRREPTYVVGRWIDANLPADARLIGQDHRGYYLPRPYAMELAHRRRTGLGRAGGPADVVDRLRSEGFTHLLLCPPIPEDAVEFDPTLGRILAPWLEGREPLYRRDLSDADGVVRRYEIHALAAFPPRAELAGRSR